MIHFFNKAKGSISIFLILVLVPMYTCAYLAIDSARYSAAKDKALGALGLAGNAALADYDRTFKELYGLFVMSKSESELNANLISYYSNMIDSDLSLGSSTSIRKLIEKTVNTSFENTINTRTENLSVSYEKPIVDTKTLSKSIRSFMKYRAPYNWAMGMSQKISAFKQTDKVSKVIDGSKSYYKSVSSAEAELKGLYNSLQKIKELDDNAEVLKVLKNVKKLLPSVRSELVASSVKASNWESTIETLEDSETKKLLSSEYKNSAASVTTESVDEFEETLQKDINSLSNAIKNSEDKDPNERNESPKDIELKFSKTPLYIYLSSAYGESSSKAADAKEQKAAMDAIASTDLSSFSGEVKKVDIPSLVSEEIYKTICNSISESGISLKGFSKLKDAALNSYEMEYILGMFGCLTTEATDKNLMGSSFGSRPLLKGETEYILFGKDNMVTNVELCVDLIFAIRLIMNSVYVYTNANMRQSALAVATAIAGWTGIGIPVAQNAILIAWATAESILDTASLCKGKSVPIYKTASTWTLGLQSLPGTLAKGVASYASKGIDDVFEKIENASVEKTEDIKDAALSYVNQAAQGTVESLASIVVTPVERVITSMTSGIKTNYSRDEIESMVLSAVNSVDASSSGAKAAKEIFVNNCMGPLVDKVYSSLPSIFTGDQTLASQAGTSITNAINDAYTTMFSKLEDVVDGYASKVEEKIISALGSTNEKVKEEAVKVINDYAASLSEFVGDSSGGSISSSSGIGMTYKDYLRIFALIGLSSKSGKENILKRSSVIMQINCSDAHSGFNITKCFVSVRLSTVTAVGNHKINLSEVYQY